MKYSEESNMNLSNRHSNPAPQPIYQSITDLVLLTGLSRSTILRRVEDGTLPKPFKIGFRTFWVRSEVMTALSKLEAER